MEFKPVLFAVDYFCDQDLIAHREPTQFIPRTNDMVMFPKDGDAYVSQMFVVEQVVIMVPENDAELIQVQVQLETDG